MTSARFTARPLVRPDLLSRVQRIASGAERDECERTADDHHVLEEMRHLVAVGKIRVRTQSRDQDVDRKRKRDHARLVADKQSACGT